MKFYKIQGAGNDYVYLLNPELKEELLPILAKKTSIRRYGIGADGLIAVYTDSKDYDAKAVIYNSDGTRAKMCGNGVRGVALLLAGIEVKPYYTVLTDSGIKTVKTLFYGRERGVFSVNVGKGEQSKIFVGGKTDSTVTLNDKEYSFTGVNVGNDHAVIFSKNAKSLIKKGKKFYDNQAFAERVNIDFVKIKDDKHIDLYVYERGSGRTFSCGTGACASVYAGIEKGYLSKDSEIEVMTEGGRLLVKLIDDELHLTGGAVMTFYGETGITV